MSSPDLIEEADDAGEAGDAAKALPAPKAGKKKKKLILIAAAAVLVLGGGGGAAMMFMGGSAKAEAGHGEEADAEGGHGDAAGKDSFVDVPAMVVNLRSPDGASRFLKIHFMIVPGSKGSPDTIKEKLPLILDAYQPFLRELRPEDLAGSAAVFRIKEEMLVRATDVAGAGMVKDILIQDLVQQ